MLIGKPVQIQQNAPSIKISEYITQVIFFSFAVIFTFYIPGFLNSLILSVSGVPEGFLNSIFNF